MLAVESIGWKGREATRLSNGVVQLIALTDGGHLADFRFVDGIGMPARNVLWEAPWAAAQSRGNRQDEVSQTGGFTGHALCLDYFGAPSPDDAAAGLPIHGEAGAVRWRTHGAIEGEIATCAWKAQLPQSQLEFERRIYLGNGESVAYVHERVYNERHLDHACHWVQHVTFSPPFLQHGESSLATSATRGVTSPLDYVEHSNHNGGSLLANDCKFQWPDAPRRHARKNAVDLRRPFSSIGSGFVAALLLDPQREVEFLVAMNWKSRLGVGYCFRRSDFPWMAVWEENCARSDEPWNGRTQARGMEFGTTPLPLGRDEMLRRGSIFATPSWCVIPARGGKTAQYMMFLFSIPADLDSIANVELERDAIVLSDERAKNSFPVAARGCGNFLARSQ